MQYAMLIYQDDGATDVARPAIDPGIAAVLARPEVNDWIRLHAAGSATTVTQQGSATLLTDGPFIDSKEYLVGLVLVEAANLDEALSVAADLQVARRGHAGAIEVRPILDRESSGA